MPRDLFGHLTSPPPPVNARNWYTVPISCLAHIGFIVPLVLAPLLATDVLPSIKRVGVFVAEGAVPPDPPPPPAPPRRIDAKPRANPDAAPLEPPDRIVPEATQPFEPIDLGPSATVE